MEQQRHHWQPIYVPMRDWLDQHPDQIYYLTQMYIDTWSFDKNFGEYFFCDSCQKYFSYDYVVGNDHTKPRLTCPMDHPLHRYWTIKDVAEYINSSLNNDTLIGYLAVDNRVGESGAVVGFAWGSLVPFKAKVMEMGPRYLNEIKDLIEINPLVPYFSEIGLANQYRGSGIGHKLAELVCQDMKLCYPTAPSLLRTHQESPAYWIYRHLGYRVFGYDEFFGNGRVLMVIDECNQFQFSNHD